MDLTAGLRAFVAVAERRSFTRGAEDCGVPQPVVSRRLANLERQLGVRLLVRTSRSVDLTDLGARMLPYAREVVARLDRIEALAREQHTELVIALPGGVDPRTLAAIRRGLEGGPDRARRARFVEQPPRRRAEALAAAEVDLALLPEAVDHAELRVPLGVATAEPVGAVFRFERLRRRPRQDQLPVPVLHLDPEDDTPAVRDPVLRAAYGHGLRADQVRIGLPRTEVLTRIHERGDCVVCTELEAKRDALAWQPIGGLRLVRGYVLRAGDGLADAEIVEPIVDRLARGLGGRRG